MALHSQNHAFLVHYQSCTLIFRPHTKKHPEMTILKPKVHFGSIPGSIFEGIEKVAADEARNLSVQIWGLPLNQV